MPTNKSPPALFYFYRVNPDVSMRKVRHFVGRFVTSNTQK